MTLSSKYNQFKITKFKDLVSVSAKNSRHRTDSANWPILLISIYNYSLVYAGGGGQPRVMEWAWQGGGRLITRGPEGRSRLRRTSQTVLPTL